MRIEKDGQIIELPSLTAVIEWDKFCFASKCPELGIASQGKTKKEAYEMLVEAVGLWLECASAKEIKRQLKHGGAVKPLEPAHA
jgi:predicted RNase H-like HicB family nuclease